MVGRTSHPVFFSQSESVDMFYSGLDSGWRDMWLCQVWQHLACADADRRGGQQGAGGRPGDVAAGARAGEGVHHHHWDAGEVQQEGPGVLQQNQLLTEDSTRSIVKCWSPVDDLVDLLFLFLKAYDMILFMMKKADFHGNVNICLYFYSADS